MNYPHPYLQPYKGKNTRHDCPSCKAKLSFTQYLDGSTHKPIHDIVGKCNRESKCGYHYTPKQYFIDHPSPNIDVTSYVSKSPLSKTINITFPLTRERVSEGREMSRGVGGKVSFSYVQKSASYKSNFIRYLCEFLSIEQIKHAGESYALGATKTKEVIFWQIDITGKVRTGKIMQYNHETGKRIKHQSGAIDWVHNKLKKSGALPQNFNLQQCFFGEHLLKIYPHKNVGIVESEKSAIIASCIVSDMIWLAAGNLNGLSIEKCHVLKGREIILYPDLGAFEKWSLKIAEIKERYNCKITISTLLEDEASDSDRANGFDIADFIISELKSKKAIPEIQSFFSPTLQSMIEKNIALFVLINSLELEEI